MQITRHKPSLLANTRGAVMAEGVIVLPVFVITLAAMVYIHGLYAAKLDASNQARSCAWHYANGGCDKSKLPKGCHQTPVNDGFEAFGGMVKKSDADKALANSSTAETAKEKSDLQKGVAGANKVGLSLLGLREGVRLQHGKDVQRPSILGGGKRTVTSNYTLMCNEIDRTPTEFAYEAYCAVGKELHFPGC